MGEQNGRRLEIDGKPPCLRTWTVTVGMRGTVTVTVEGAAVTVEGGGVLVMVVVDVTVTPAGVVVTVIAYLFQSALPQSRTRRHRGQCPYHMGTNEGLDLLD